MLTVYVQAAIVNSQTLEEVARLEKVFPFCCSDHFCQKIIMFLPFVLLWHHKLWDGFLIFNPVAFLQCLPTMLISHGFEFGYSC